MPFSEPVGEETVSGEYYSVAFRSVVDEAVVVRVVVGGGDSGPFFGADSDAMVQEIVDLLSKATLMQFVSASRSWPERRILTPTPSEVDPME